MQCIITFIFLILILLSCKQKGEIDDREPFEINRNLDCELLIENGYSRIYGVDVTLIGIENPDTLIHYQIFKHEEYQDGLETNTFFSKGISSNF